MEKIGVMLSSLAVRMFLNGLGLDRNQNKKNQLKWCRKKKMGVH